MIGRSIGIFTLDYEKLSKAQYIEGIIRGVEKFKTEETKKIILDNISLLDYNDLQYIQQVTKLKVLDGKRVNVYFLPEVLKQFSNLLANTLINKEILIISDDSFFTYNLVKSLSRQVKFLTIIGNDREYLEEISKEIYNVTGLSIFYTQNINKILKNYNVIINLNEEICIDLNKLRSKTIIFDLSVGKKLAKRINKDNKNIVVIEDFLFRYEQSEISSFKYEVFEKFNREDFKKVLVKNKSYTLKELINKKIRNKVYI